MIDLLGIDGPSRWSSVEKHVSEFCGDDSRVMMLLEYLP